MKLIKLLETKKIKNKTYRWGLFLCPYCNKENEWEKEEHKRIENL